MPTMCSVTSVPSASSSIAPLAEPGAPAKRAPEVAEEGRGPAREARRPHEMEADGAAGVQVEPIGEHEARGRLIDGARVCGAALADIHPFDAGPEATVGGQDREEVDGPDPVPGAGRTREHQARRGPGTVTYLGQPRHIIEIHRARQAERAVRPATTASLPRIVRVKSRYALLVLAAPGEQAEDPAAGDTSDDRDAEPCRPAATKLRAESQRNCGHRPERTNARRCPTAPTCETG